MKIRFIGASDNQVTGSCTHFSFERKKIQFLVDCGLFQGEAHASHKNESPFPFNPSEIKFVLLTHAHLDHCGLIPKLYRDGFRGAVLCTSATAELCKLSLMDSVRFADEIYSESDVKKIKFSHLDQRPDFGLSRHIPIDEDLFVSLTRSAHILGAVSINISWMRDDDSRGSIVMSGDLGNNTKKNPYQPLLAGRQEPFGVPDYMVVESTYGNRRREPKYSDYDSRISALAAVVRKAIFERKKLLIPAFSLQRTQEILFDLVCIFRTKDEKYLPTGIPVVPDFVAQQFASQGWWDKGNNLRIEEALAQSSDPVKALWKDAIMEYQEDTTELSKFQFSPDARVSFSNLGALFANYKKQLGLKLLIDSPLTLKMTGVFSTELNRRQHKNPEETLYRNRAMTERLGVCSEAEVDEILKKIFPIGLDALEDPDIPIPIENHHLLYGKASHPKQSYSKKSKTPDAVKAADITISGSGMCQGGRVVQHLSRLLPKERAVILITGYMDPGTLGGQLAELAQCRLDGTDPSFVELVVDGKNIPVHEIKADIVNLAGYYSGHTDQAGLLDFIFTNKRQLGDDDVEKSTTVFINHGTRESRQGLQKAIEDHPKIPGQRLIKEVTLASAEKWYDLDKHVWLEPEPPEEMMPSKMLSDLLQEQKKTNDLLGQLLRVMEQYQNVPK